MASLSLIVATNSLGIVNFIPSLNPVEAHAEERITLASYTLTKAQTKDLAKAMTSIKGNGNLKTLILGLAAKWGGVYGWAATLAAQLSSNAQYKQIVIDAANQNKRVKITITDSKNYHTSYSTQIKYTKVN